jgi:4-amino-4-deoxychorismate mutase
MRVNVDDSLRPLRDDLDRIDERLLAALRERMTCCIHIAEVKRDNGIPMMQPHRVDAVHKRARSYAEAHGLDQEYLIRLYQLIIAETCRVEDEVIGRVNS